MSDPTPRPIRSILIANRGEIACRVMQTAQRLGLRSIAIFHAIERDARHCRMADAAFEIRGETPVAAHLDGAQIIATALQAGADAIHPGYGFLSENAGFAKAVQDTGLCFIGPSPAVIALMGDKISARDFAARNSVPVAPSVAPSDDPAAFARAAAAIGFPLLIKAAAGGGGKGMSIVRHADELIPAAQRAADEALRYFGDGRIYAETWIERPRHIEVQILGDGRGGAIHLRERECSVQRRFQKIVEEAPAPQLAPDLADQICAAALRLARAAEYENAGTVEFILTPENRFYFLEMNTRLQVEHPVTEMITGLDLVEAQINIAAGRGLPVLPDPLIPRGHAIECRICAEDPARDFLPETGRIRLLDIPRAPWLRFEHALSQGQDIGTGFDPMLAKLVAHGETRDQAIDRAISALRSLVLLGVGSNIDFLIRLLDHPQFRAGALHTGFLTEHGGDLAPAPTAPRKRDHALIAAALGLPEFRALIHDVPQLHAALGPWRN